MEVTEVSGALVRERIVRLLSPDMVVPLTFEMWEDRILPLLSELGREGGLRACEFSAGGEKVGFLGNDRRFLEKLGDKESQAGVVRPDLFLVAFSGLTDLSVLRRFKDYPDETGRNQLEEPWVAECVQARSLIVLNAKI